MTYSLRSKTHASGVRPAGRARLAGRDEDLAEYRLDGDGARSNRAVVGRDVAPADHALSLFGRDPLEELLESSAGPSPRAVGRSGRRRIRRPRQRHRGDLPQERIGNLQQHARAVAGVDLAATRPPVLQVLEDLQGLPHDAVRLSALDVHDEADSAGVVLVDGSYRPVVAWVGRSLGMRGAGPSLKGEQSVSPWLGKTPRGKNRGVLLMPQTESEVKCNINILAMIKRDG